MNYFYTTDHLGSVRELTDTAKVIRARYDYDPCGRLTKVSGDLEANFGFTGFYRHATSGLDLTLYRAYDSEHGRWISRDPIGENGGLNLYGYVGNNPLRYLDPLGLWWSQIIYPPTSIGNKKHSLAADSPVTSNYQIAMEGNENYVYDENGGPLTAKELARIIRKTTGYKEGMPVDLYACNTGNTKYSSNPFAKQLAKELGVVVNAPSSYLWFNLDGTISIGGSTDVLHPENGWYDPDQPGQWEHFTP